jgi:hypothetical protein
MKRLLFFASLLIAIVMIAAMAMPRRATVHRISIPGHPGKTVDFILCYAMTGEYGYIVRFGGAETKHAFIPGEVSVKDVQTRTRIKYHDQVLTVYGPTGQWIEAPGFIP